MQWLPSDARPLAGWASSRTRGDDGLKRRLGHYFRHGCRRPRENDHDLDASIAELMFELTRRIERIDVNLHAAGPDDAQEGDRKCEQIRHHDRNSIALPHAELRLQVT